MPIIKSAKKRLKQSKVKTARNTAYERGYKSALKTLRTGTKKGAEALKTAYKAIDKAAKKGVIHKKKASRLKSNASKLANVKKKAK